MRTTRPWRPRSWRRAPIIGTRTSCRRAAALADPRPLALELADLSLAAKADIEALAERWLRLELLAKETQRLHEDAHAQLLARCRAHHLADTVHRVRSRCRVPNGTGTRWTPG